jgi:hypothetical protein
MYSLHITVSNYAQFVHIFAISIKQKQLYSSLKLIDQKKTYKEIAIT